MKNSTKSPEVIPPSPALLDVRDLARTLGLSTRACWRARDAGLLPPPLKIGGAIRWREADIREWIERGCPATKGRA